MNETDVLNDKLLRGTIEWKLEQMQLAARDLRQIYSPVIGRWEGRWIGPENPFSTNELEELKRAGVSPPSERELNDKLELIKNLGTEVQSLYNQWKRS